MKFTIDKNDMKKAMSIIGALTKSNRHMPLIQNCKINVSEGFVSIVGTDLETSVHLLIKALTQETGECLVNGKAFQDIINSSANGLLGIFLSDSLLRVVDSLGFNHALQIEPDASDFPSYNHETISESNHMMSINTPDLYDILSSVIPSMSKDETRYHLNSSFLDYSNNCFVSTDGHRLAKVVLPDNSLDENAKTIESKKDFPIFPSTGLRHLFKCIKKSIGSTSLYINGNDSVWTSLCGDIYCTIRMKLIEGAYPNWQQLLPKKHKVKSRVLVKNLLKSLNYLKPSLHPRNKGVKFYFDNSEMHMTAHYVDGDCRGETKIAASYNDKSKPMKVNAMYLIDVLKNCRTDEIDLFFTDELSPIMFNPVGSGVENVIMPMRL